MVKYQRVKDAAIKERIAYLKKFIYTSKEDSDDEVPDLV